MTKPIIIGFAVLLLIIIVAYFKEAHKTAVPKEAYKYIGLPEFTMVLSIIFIVAIIGVSMLYSNYRKSAKISNS